VSLLSVKGNYTTIEVPDYELDYVTPKVNWEEDRKKVDGVPGVYFLMNGWELIYVGESINILNRARQHSKGEEDKIFDGLMFLRIDNKWEMEVVQNFLIGMFEPKHNRAEYNWRTDEEIEYDFIMTEFAKVEW